MWVLWSSRRQLGAMAVRRTGVRCHSTPATLTTLVMPYGSDFLGFHVGPTCHPQVPAEVSLAILTECVPFHQDALLIGLSRGGGNATRHRAVDESLQSDLRDHFQSATLRSLVPPRPPPAAGQPHSTSASPSSPALVTLPTESLSPQSLDAVIFGSNVFAMLLQRSPQHITACHRVLRPHGVLAVVGQRRLTVTGPPDARDEWNDFVEYLLDKTTCDGPSQWMQDSIQSAHEDVYFPYPHVRRRIFTSTFRLTVAQLVDHVRSWELYQAYTRSALQLDNEFPGVRRRRNDSPTVDPLRTLGSLLETRLETLEVTVDTFVITCDSRPVNSRRSGEESVGQFPSQSSLSR